MEYNIPDIEQLPASQYNVKLNIYKDCMHYYGYITSVSLRYLHVHQKKLILNDVMAFWYNAKNKILNCSSSSRPSLLQ